MPPIEPIPQWRAYRHVRLSLVIALLYVSRISFGLQRRFRSVVAGAPNYNFWVARLD